MSIEKYYTKVHNNMDMFLGINDMNSNMYKNNVLVYSA